MGYKKALTVGAGDTRNSIGAGMWKLGLNQKRVEMNCAHADQVKSSNVVAKNKQAGGSPKV